MKTIITLISFLTVFIAQAQWTNDTDVNTLVADSEALDMQAKGTSDGMTYIVFWKNVGAPVNIELRLQILDADGNQTLGADGMLISDQIPMSTFTVLWNIVVDADDHLYIGVTGTGGGDPAYVFKLDSDGNHLWDASGVNVGSGNKVTILPLTEGGAIVSWLASNGAVMQKYDGSGSPVWPSTQPIELSSGFTAPGNFFELSGGDYIAVFHSLLSGINSNLYAQRYDDDGNPVWTEATQISEGLTAFNRNYTGTQDDDVVYMGYFSAANNRFDSFLQRINSDGTLPWGINGVDFDVNQTDFETNTEIAFSQGSDVVWSVCTYTDSNQGQHGEYVQKFDKNTGARELTDNAKVVFPIGSEKVHAGSLQLKNDSPLFLNKEGEDNGATPTTLNAVYLDENGNFAWAEETKPVATFAASKGRVQYSVPVNNQSVAVFVEDKGDGPKMYAQNVVDEELGTEEFSNASLSYTNPVQDEIALNSTVAIEVVAIYNTLSQQVFTKTYSGATQMTIDVQGWAPGIYIMKLNAGNGLSKSIKLIKN
ncbi:T9SS type A sorting domain-containing protein [Marixanthomonas ophiurae]|nr:T9SS type A sorting domain-containing protein [Marixanthomonas ophiurae]